MCSAEDYRAKAAEYERLTRVTKSLRESRKYRKQAKMYRALALGEEPDISPATRAGANRCSNRDAPITAPCERRGRRRQPVRLSQETIPYYCTYLHCPYIETAE